MLRSNLKMKIKNLESREEDMKRISDVLSGRTTSESLPTREQVMIELQGTLTKCPEPLYPQSEDYGVI